MRSFYAFLAALPAAFAAPAKVHKTGPINNQWIVKLHEGATSADLQSVLADAAHRFGASPMHVYDFSTFKGFSVRGSSAVASAMDNNDNVVFVEQDQVVTVNSLITQADPPYGLARISHRQKGATTYLYDSSAGEGSYAYIIDTGIYTGHSEFEGRATFGANFVDDDNTDDNGHGTHVSGTIGGRTYGVAKKTNLIGVKVLGTNGVGDLSAVIAGLDWAVQDAKNNSRIDKAVANLSLGSSFSQVVNDAVTAAVNEGLFVAVAAGNSNVPVKQASPASAPLACTIGAVDENDVRAGFSNFGQLVDVWAPGVNVESAWISGSDSTAVLSGTSMASPHIAGLGAYLLGLGFGSPGGDALCSSIKKIATTNVVVDNKGSTKKIAFDGGGAEVIRGFGQS